MAIKPDTKYGSQVDTSDSAGYPYGRAQNVTISGDGTGTPLEEAWVSDIWGFFQQLLARAEITPTGTPDKVGASQYQDALDVRFGMTGNLTSISWEALSGTFTSHVEDVSALNPTLGGVGCSDTGHRFFTVNGPASTVSRYDMSTPFDQTTMTYDSNRDFSTWLSTATYDMQWRPNGLGLYLSGSHGGSARVIQWTPSPAWTVAQAGSIRILDASATLNNASAIDFTDDGARLYVLGLDVATSLTQKLWAWDLSTPYVIDTASRNASEDIDLPNPPLATITGFCFSPEGRLFYVTGDKIYEKFIGGAISERSRDITGMIEGNMLCCRFSPDGQRFYIGTTTEDVHSMYSSLVRVA